jgi:hypothetical protein
VRKSNTTKDVVRATTVTDDATTRLSGDSHALNSGCDTTGGTNPHVASERSSQGRSQVLASLANRRRTHHNPLSAAVTGRVTMKRPRGRRAFSLLELAISVALFMFLATTVTVLVTSASANQTTATRTSSLTQAVSAELQAIASEPYANVASATITAPNHCANNEAASCVTVEGVTYTVTYSICPSQPTAACTSATGSTTEPASTTGLPSAYTDVTATVEGQPIAPITQRVLAPFNTFATTTTGVLVNVDIPSPTTGHNEPAALASAYTLYLLNSSNDQVAASTIGTGTVLFSVPSGSCSASSPCHVGLSTGSGYDISPDGAYALRAGSALTPIVATTGSVVSVPAGIFSVTAPTTIALEAQNTGAATSPSSADIDSVCIWGSFFDGTQNRVTPFCNSTSASTISLATYAPNPAQPGVRFAIDPKAGITLSVDDPSGTCPNVGAKVFSPASAWVAGAECTSWTWGVPDGFGTQGSVTPTKSAGVDTTPGINHTTGVVTSLVHNNGASDELLWSSLAATSANPGNVQGSPASGYAGEPSWSKPRTTSSTGCSADATCGSLVGEVAPEATLCPLLHCLSTALFQPYLITPVTNSVTMQNGVASFTLSVGDLDTAAPISTTLTSAPSSGTLALSGTATTAGQVLGTGTTGSSYALTYTSNTPSSAPSDSFQVTLSNGQPGSAVLETIYLLNGQVVTTVTATPSPVSVVQGGTTSVTLHATDANGAVVAGAALMLNSTVPTTYDRYFPSALSLPATVTTNASGNATFSISAATTASADSGDAKCPCYGVTVSTTLSSALATVPVTITPAASSTIISPDQNATTTSSISASQGGSVDVYGSVRDLSGGVLDTTPVSFSVACTASGYTTCPYAGLISVTPSSCTPSSTTSNCGATLTVASTAPASVNGVTYTVTASSSVYSLSSSTTLTVKPLASTISFVSTPTIVPGTSGTVTVQLLDGAGNPLAGYNVSLSSSLAALTFTSSTAATNASGVATFTDQANASASPASATLTASASTVTSKYPTYAPTITTTGSVTISAAVATVTSVSPSSGPGEGGNTSAITVTGTGFSGASSVVFGSAPASSFTVVSPTTIIIPAGATPNDAFGGIVDVHVVNATGTSAAAAGDQYTFLAAPTVTGVSPATGPDAGASSVTITGTGFTGATAVHFGTTAATTFTVNSSTSVTVTSPQHSSGTVDITVTAAGGPNVTTSADQFAYVAQALTITATSNTITYGSAFTQSLSAVTLISGDAVTATYTYTGTGTTTYGPSSDPPTNVGTYSVTPSTAVFSPGTASNYAITYVAGTLTINQASFAVAFGSAPTGVETGETPGTHLVTATTTPPGTGSVVFTSATTSVCTVNSVTGALTPLTTGTCTIDANDAGSQSYAAAPQVAQSFTVNPGPPTVTAVTPSNGPMTGGTSVTLTGTNFTGATAVKFGTNAATTYTVNSASSITVTSPSATATGTVDITVTTTGGTSATSSSDDYTYNAAAPGAPTAVTGAVASPTSALVGWTPPASNGGSSITLYTVTATDITNSSDAGNGATCTSTTTSCTMPGLTTGDSYTFTATATNAAATGPASAAGPARAVTAASMPVSGLWDSVTYGNGVFLATDITTDIDAYSTNGTTWTESTLPAGTDWRAITYGNGEFVALDGNSTVAAYSANGSTWTTTTLPANINWDSVTYGNGVFVAIAGGSTTAAYSTNGVTWTESTLPSTQGMSIAYGNGVFVATSGGTSSAVSTNGSTWTLATMPAGASWTSIAYGNGEFVAVSQNSTSVAYSANGTAWALTAIPVDSYWFSVTYGDGEFVAVNGNGLAVAYSSNGVNWSVSNLLGNVEWESVTYGNGEFVATSFNSTDAAALTIGLLIATPPSAPATPTASSASATSATVSWTAPAANGSPISSYTVTSSAGGFTCTTTTSSCTVTGLTTGTSYTFTVAAFNGAGNSPASPPSNAVVPSAPPGAPTGVSAAIASPTSVTVSWTAPTSNGGSAITLYTATSSTGSLTCATATTSCTITGLTTGTSYTFSVTATNGVGTSVPSSSSGAVTPAGAPGAPTAVTASVASTTSALVSWTAPASTGGAPITLYTATAAPGGLNCSSTTTSCTIVGLTDGSSYTFTVTATNAAGTSTASSAAPSTGTWTAASAPGTASGISPMAYGNGVFVVVSASGAAYSTNGTTWTAATVPSQVWASVAYGDGEFVATSGTDYDNVITSTNGVTWTETTGALPANGIWTSITYGDGKFVAVAQNTSTVAYSTNGTTWTAATLPAVGGADGEYVTYGNGMFVAVGFGSTAGAYSTNGITWTATTLPSAVEWLSLTYGNGMFVAAGIGKDIAYSTNGTTWTVSTTALASSEDWDSIAYGNGEFVAVSMANDVVAYSTNGVTWTAGVDTATKGLYSVAYGNNVFAAVSDGSTADVGATYSFGLLIN